MSVVSVLRLMQLLSPQNDNINPVPVGQLGLPEAQLTEPPEYDPYSRLRDLYQPRTDISQLYSQVLQQTPQFTGVSTPRKIGAVAAGALLGLNNPNLGLQVAHNIGYGPYERQVEQYNNRIRALSQGAAEEDRYNQNQRILALDTIGKEQNQAKIAETERKNLAAEELKKEDQKIRQQRADAYQYRTEHPNYEAKVLADGSLLYVNPQNPSDQQKFNVKVNELTLSDREALIRAQGAESRATKATPSGGSSQPRYQIVQPLDADGKPNGPPVRINIDTTETQPVNIGGFTKAPPRAANTSSSSPTAQLAAQRLAVSKLIQERPDLTPYIQIGTGGIITVAPVGSGGSILTGRKGLSKEDRDLIVSRIQGTNNSAPASTTNKVRVRAPDGRTGTVSVDDSKNLPKGWVIIK